VADLRFMSFSVLSDKFTANLHTIVRTNEQRSQWRRPLFVQYKACTTNTKTIADVVLDVLHRSHEQAELADAVVQIASVQASGELPAAVAFAGLLYSA